MSSNLWRSEPGRSAVATVATISYLPGVGGGAEYRAASFEECLVSIGLSNKTINCYRLTLIRATVAAARGDDTGLTLDRIAVALKG